MSPCWQKHWAAIVMKVNTNSWHQIKLPEFVWCSSVTLWHIWCEFRAFCSKLISRAHDASSLHICPSTFVSNRRASADSSNGDTDCFTFTCSKLSVLTLVIPSAPALNWQSLVSCTPALLCPCWTWWLMRADYGRRVAHPFLTCGSNHLLFAHAEEQQAHSWVSSWSAWLKGHSQLGWAETDTCRMALPLHSPAVPGEAGTSP